MHAVVFASVGALAVYVTLPVLAAEPNAALRPAAPYNGNGTAAKRSRERKERHPGQSDMAILSSYTRRWTARLPDCLPGRPND
jgi:hypothetical protein